VRLEGLRQLKKANYFVGNETCDFPAFNIVRQPSSIQRLRDRKRGNVTCSGSCLTLIKRPGRVAHILPSSGSVDLKLYSRSHALIACGLIKHTDNFTYLIDMMKRT
jgi:hypothetical protein